MNDIPISILLGILAVLVLLSGFFSSSETGMMSLNRYRLRHRVKSNDKSAKRVSKLLEKPDRLIGTILTGNNLVNFAAAALATIISQRLWPDNPDLAVFVNTIIFTLIVLIFAELTPKTLAAIAPEKIAFPASYVLSVLQWLLYPFVWFVNVIANNLIKLLRVNIHDTGQDNLSREELRTVVHESGSMIPKRHRSMLVSILDLEKMTVNDILVPRNEIIGINIEDDTNIITEQLSQVQHTRLPVYKQDINQVVGLLHVRSAVKFLKQDSLDKDELLKLCAEPYFIPENTPLHTQLYHFQKNQRRMGMVVDEYGDVLGICTLEDILEEIVGEFTTDVLSMNAPDVHYQDDGSFIIDGSAHIREVNRMLHWDLPNKGPKTFNGLILETLEFIPSHPCCLQIDRYQIEIITIENKTIRSARVTAINN